MNTNERVTSAEAEDFFINAQCFERTDDRWTIANSFFQKANYERRLISRVTSAILASDWSSFGYRDYTLEEYLQREVEAQRAYRRF